MEIAVINKPPESVKYICMFFHSVKEKLYKLLKNANESFMTL